MAQASPHPETSDSLAELLIKRNLISQAQVELAQEIQKRRGENLRDILIRMGWVSEDDIIKLEGKLWNIPVFDPKHLEKLDAEMLNLIPEYFSRKYNILPIWRENGRVWVAMSDPFDLVAIDDLQRVTKCEVQPLIISEAEVKKYIDQYYQKKDIKEKQQDEGGEDLKEQIIEEMAEFQLDIDEGYKGEEDEEEQLKVNASDPPVVRLVNFMLVQAIDDKASDIHVEPREDGIKVRYRVDGALFDLVSSPKKFKASILSRLKILSGMDIAVKRVPQDGAFTIRKNGKEVDFRVSSLPTIYGEKIVLRLLVRDAVTGNTLEGLDMGERNLRLFKKYIYRPHGMILVTGPTGSGKSTTLYTVLNTINDPRKNIITVEDPCEYRLEGIQQVQVRPDLGFDFADALRTILRQDPDIVMIGEIRDQETAQIAVKASLTGHLVLSTLHTNDAPGAIVRLVNIGIEEFLVASSVTLAVAQRLVRRVCPECKESYEATIEEKEVMGVDPKETLILHRGRGCKRCRKTGYSGRAAVFEVLEMTPEIRRMMLEGASMDAIREKAIESGMESLRECGFRRVREGITTVESVLATCVEEA
jgi:type IV pilus assembly protein PilB